MLNPRQRFQQAKSVIVAFGDSAAAANHSSACGEFSAFITVELFSDRDVSSNLSSSREPSAEAIDNTKN